MASIIVKFLEAQNEYFMATLKNPTHLVLGRQEHAEFLGFLEVMAILPKETQSANGYLACRGKSYCGMGILKSVKDSLVLAVELDE